MRARANNTQRNIMTTESSDANSYRLILGGNLEFETDDPDELADVVLKRFPNAEFPSAPANVGYCLIVGPKGTQLRGMRATKWVLNPAGRRLLESF
jgi:hypothetical protein